MDNEFAVLNYLNKNQDTTQRKIARGTNLSPGAVNFLLKKLVKKGFVKFEKINGRTIRYIITPQGMAEKSRLTYRFMKNSYKQIIKINNALEEIVQNTNREKFVFYGPRDEIMELLKIAAGNMDLDYEVVTGEDEIKALDPLVVTWDPDTEKGISDKYRVVNILSIV